MKNKTIVVIALMLSLRLVAAAAAASPSYIGETYAEATATNSLFSVERYWSTNGNKQVLTEAFKDTKGNLAASLETTYVAGRLAVIQFKQKQTDETATAEFRNGRIFYSTTANQKTKTSEESVAGEWAAFNAVPDYISKHWDSLAKGGVVNFRIPIPAMRDSFGFSLSRTKTWTEKGQKCSEFRLESTSAIIRLLADPMFYVFNDSDQTLVEYRGRVIAKLNAGGKLKDLDATIKYRQQNQ